MGIRGLGVAVRRYGKFSSLNGDTVVIDGPALVHQIYDGCMRQRPPTNGFICQPSYATLGRMVTGWLDELRQHNVAVRKIIFDGYLPPGKWQVRQQRLLEQSQLMKGLLASHPDGSCVLPEDAFETIKSGIILTQTVGASSNLRWLPRPPFLVPAVVEILKGCRTWGPLVEVVSGEADMFCAEDIRRHGGVLLTSDSDLLITDLGHDGSVSFFADIAVTDRSAEPQGLLASKFSLESINDALALNNLGGLPRVAYEIARSRSSFNEALERIRNRNYEDILHTSEYQTFLEEYSMKEYLPMDHRMQSMISTLDPRISEIVIQTLLFTGDGIVPDVNSAQHSRGPETLAMFLPILIEDRSRISAWTNSTAVRQVAYSIMQTFAVHKSPVVIEYRTLMASNTSIGRQVDVLGLEEAYEQCSSLVHTLKQLANRIPSADMRWLAFAIYQDVMWSTSEERSPLSASLIHKAELPSDDERWHSWDMIHFTAQVEASLYSLRITNQILDVAVSLAQDLPPQVRELCEHLDALPAIADWPTLESMPHLLATAKKVDILAIITDILGIPPIQVEEKSTETNGAKRREKRKNGTGLLRSERDPKRPVSVNPFAVLSNTSQD
ncbi:hypothetical protein F5B22DRAFT_658973 [Xylaria bambusicola]|uniref:uncharacterized protein n=1 Tax=Xylaria bambusicola TaxID=326684 RepID=UPI0020086B4A|nr:uncharacterized protein F5B22DRAFT_658973 [Xylaria bambusicola]KAI0508664.1 hypothetical protein F5B22DRAFT_658973 [Xylaria bambusicola]